MFPLIHRAPSVNSVSLIRQIVRVGDERRERNASAGSQILSGDNQSTLIRVIAVKSGAIMTLIGDRNWVNRLALWIESFSKQPRIIKISGWVHLNFENSRLTTGEDCQIWVKYCFIYFTIVFYWTYTYMVSGSDHGDNVLVWQKWQEFSSHWTNTQPSCSPHHVHLRSSFIRAEPKSFCYLVVQENHLCESCSDRCRQDRKHRSLDCLLIYWKTITAKHKGLWVERDRFRFLDIFIHHSICTGCAM